MIKNVFERTYVVPITVWVTRKSDMGIKHISDPDGYPWRSAVRHSNGVMQWQWHKTKREAIEWCEQFKPKEEPCTK